MISSVSEQPKHVMNILCQLVHMPCIVMAVQDHPSRLYTQNYCITCVYPMQAGRSIPSLSSPARGHYCRAQYMPIHTYHLPTQIHAVYIPA